MISPISTSNVEQILCSTVRVTSSSRRSRVIVFGAIPAAFRRSALLIFLSTSSFQSLLYEIAMTSTSGFKYRSNYTAYPSAKQEGFAYGCETLFSCSSYNTCSTPNGTKSDYRNNVSNLSEQYTVDFHRNSIRSFVTKVNSIMAWDYPKIAVCTDTGCACYSLKSYSPVGTPHKIPLHFTTDI